MAVPSPTTCVRNVLRAASGSCDFPGRVAEQSQPHGYPGYPGRLFLSYDRQSCRVHPFHWYLPSPHQRKLLLQCHRLLELSGGQHASATFAGREWPEGNYGDCAGATHAPICDRFWHPVLGGWADRRGAGQQRRRSYDSRKPPESSRVFMVLWHSRIVAHKVFTHCGDRFCKPRR